MCKSRPLASDVTYGGWAHGYWGKIEVKGNISRKAGTQIYVSRLSQSPRCGSGRTELWVASGIYRVSGNSATWAKVDPADAQFIGIAARSDAKVLYKDLDPLTYYTENFSRSEDGGRTWIKPKFRLLGAHTQQAQPQEEDRLVFDLQAISPQEPLTVFATVVKLPLVHKSAERVFPHYELLGLYISKDGGDSWMPFYSKISGVVFTAPWERREEDEDDNRVPKYTTAFTLAPSNPSVMYGYADGDIIKSVDAGRTWAPLSLKQELSRDRILTDGFRVEFANKVAFSNIPLADPGKMGGADAGFQDYYLRQLGLPRQWLSQIIVDPTNENIVYVVAETGIYRTMDGGKSWSLLDLGFDELDGIDSIAINQNDPAQIFVGTVEGLYMSHDHGCHFEKITIPPDALQCVEP
jgi:hypothetical protein